MIRALMLSWLVNKSVCVRTPPWMLRCSAAACGAPLQTTWTRWWSTACCLSSTSETGWPSPRQGPTPWGSPSAPPPTHQRPLCTTSSPPGTGKGLRHWRCSHLEWETEHIFCVDFVLVWRSFSSPRYEMQDTGVTHEATLKNFSLVPCFHNSCHTEAALSVPA